VLTLVVPLALGAGFGAYLGLRDEGEERSAAVVNPHPPAGGFVADRTQLADCGSDWRCLEQAFGNLAYFAGPGSALRVFDTRIRTDRAAEADCHRIAHTIGSAALARFRGDIAQAFAKGSASCNSGYFHGILEHAFLRARTARDIARVARQVCTGSLVRRTRWLEYNCVHGLGHGLMIQGGYDLRFALRNCDELQTRWAQTSCTGGVFMENINAAVTTPYGFKTRWLRDDDLVYPCNSVARRHKLYCYLLLTSRVLKANGYDWPATARVCRAVAHAWVDYCFQSFGRDASGFTRQKPARILPLCALAKRYAGECLFGAARDLTGNYANGDRAATLCRQASVAYRSRCFYGIGTIIGTLVAADAERRVACTRATRAYTIACERGAKGI
jgi:hypothetical protein